MNSSRIINKYFSKYKVNLDYEKVNSKMKPGNIFIDKKNNNEILRLFLADHIEVCIKTNKNQKKDSYIYKYKKNSNLLIIGFSLEGQIHIDYNGKNLIHKSEVFYFRPKKDFYINTFNHRFLYYILDLNNFENSISPSECKKCDKCNTLFCDAYLDSICKKGELHVKEAPYIVRSSKKEIIEIENVDMTNFLECVNVKGKLFNYLNYLLKMRESTNYSSNKKGRRLHICRKNRVSRAKKIIVDNLDKQISIGEIAKKLDISEYKLQNCFKNVEGTTVYNYILKVKIDRAKSLLSETAAPIIEIAQNLGYENPSKFSTTFKRMTGQTPSEYREDCRINLLDSRF